MLSPDDWKNWNPSNWRLVVGQRVIRAHHPEVGVGTVIEIRHPALFPYRVAFDADAAADPILDYQIQELRPAPADAAL